MPRTEHQHRGRCTATRQRHRRRRSQTCVESHRQRPGSRASRSWTSTDGSSAGVDLPRAPERTRGSRSRAGPRRLLACGRGTTQPVAPMSSTRLAAATARPTSRHSAHGAPSTPNRLHLHVPRGAVVAARWRRQVLRAASADAAARVMLPMPSRTHRAALPAPRGDPRAAQAACRTIFDPAGLTRARRPRSRTRWGRAGFWDDQERAARVSAEHARASRKLNVFRELERDVEDLEPLAELAEEDPEIATELEEQVGPSRSGSRSSRSSGCSRAGMTPATHS